MSAPLKAAIKFAHPGEREHVVKPIPPEELQAAINRQLALVAEHKSTRPGNRDILALTVWAQAHSVLETHLQVLEGQARTAWKTRPVPVGQPVPQPVAGQHLPPVVDLEPDPEIGLDLGEDFEDGLEPQPVSRAETKPAQRATPRAKPETKWVPSETTHPKPQPAPPKEKTPMGPKPLPNEEKRDRMVQRFLAICKDIPKAKTRAVADHLRHQGHSTRFALKEVCKNGGLDIPGIPDLPPNPFTAPASRPASTHASVDMESEALALKIPIDAEGGLTTTPPVAPEDKPAPDFQAQLREHLQRIGLFKDGAPAGPRLQVLAAALRALKDLPASTDMGSLLEVWR